MRFLNFLFFIFFLFLINNKSSAQIIYYEDFEDPTTVNWQLNTVNFWVGSNGFILNRWEINNSYLGGANPVLGVNIPDTDPQPPLINNSPNSGYLHTVVDTLTNTFPVIDNNSAADAPNILGFNEIISAEMFSGISTVGVTGVELGFWWICDNVPAANNGGGYLYFSIDGGNTWIFADGPLNSDTWNYYTYSNPAFDNVADLRFSMAFNADMGAGGILAQGGFGMDDFTVSTSAPCFAELGNDTILCEGENIILDASVSTSASFIWSTGDTTSSIFVDTTGMYVVDISDNTGCQYTDSIFVSYATPVLITDSIVNPSTCGASDGEIIINASGGIPPYYYSVDNGLTYSGSNIITNLVTGFYPIVIFDAAGCYSNHQNILLQEPSDINAVFSTNPPLCGSPGSISITGSSSSVLLGSADLYYSIDGGVNISASDLSGNTVLVDSVYPGQYTLTVTDLNCTTIIDTVSFAETEVFIDSIGVVGVDCFGDATGAISVYMSGGTGVYNYSLTDFNGNNTQSINNFFTGLLAGDYTILASDVNCSSQTSVQVLQTGELVSQAFVVNDNNGIGIPCYGSSTGQVAVQVLGGDLPYIYQWLDLNGNIVLNPTSNSQILSNIPSGTYISQVTDNLGCVSIDTVSIFENNQIITSVNTENTSCFGSSDGTVNLLPSGGVAPYEYWYSSSSNWDTSSSLGGFNAGTYWVIVRDSEYCTDTVFFDIDQPLPLNVNAVSTNVSCYGYNDGEVDAFVTGGTQPYSYSWTVDGGPSNTIPISGDTSSIFNLQPNTSLYDINGVLIQQYNYNVLVTDANGCQSNASAFVDEPQSIILTQTNTIDAYCLQAFPNTGSVTVLAQGGVPHPIDGYSFTWDFQSSVNAYVGFSNTQNNLNADTFNVVVVDSNGCSASLETIIPLSETMTSQFNINSHNTCYGDNDGEIIVQAYSGCGNTNPCNYTYTWIGPSLPVSGIGGQIAPNLQAGTYSYFIEDDWGCEVTGSVEILQPDQVQFSVDVEDLTCQGDPSSVSFTNSDDGVIYLDLTGGNGVYDYHWSEAVTSFSQNDILNGDPSIDNSILIENLFMGDWQISVTDSNGCIGVPAFDSPIIPSPTFPISADFMIMSSIVQSTNPNILTSSLNCWGDSTGFAQVYQYNPDFDYYWFETSGSNNLVDTGAFANNLPAGDIVVVSEYVGPNGSYCNTSSQPVVISEPLPLTVSADVFDESCVDFNDGTIILPNGWSDVSGGNQFDVNFSPFTPYILTWNVNSNISINNFSFTGLNPGTYSVSVEDANGCNRVNYFTVNPADPLAIDFNTSDYNGYGVSCFGQSNGTAQAVVSGGENPYTYSWNHGPTGMMVNSLSANTTYIVNVLDANNCALSNEIVLSQPLEFLVDITSTNVSCNGGGDGTISFDITGGVQPYSPININPGTPNPNALNAGNYNVIATDANGCNWDDNIEITEPSPLVLTLTPSDYNGFNVSCFGYNDGSLIANVNGGTPDINGNYLFEWSTDFSEYSSVNSSIFNLSQGSYDITVTDGNNCVIQMNQVMTQPLEIISDFNSNYIVSLPAPFSIDFTEQSINADSWYWELNGSFVSTDPNIQIEFDTPPLDIGEQEVVLYSYNNGGICVSTDTMMIVIQGINNFNVFTPNGDGINDNFYFENFGMQNLTAVIMNRWGEKVYEFNDMYDVWDGYSLSGQEVPDGVYFYILESQGEDGSPYSRKGSVTLIR